MLVSGKMAVYPSFSYIFIQALGHPMTLAVDTFFVDFLSNFEKVIQKFERRYMLKQHIANAKLQQQKKIGYDKTWEHHTII